MPIKPFIIALPGLLEMVDDFFVHSKFPPGAGLGLEAFHPAPEFRWERDREEDRLDNLNI
jgi:hypothetical protein